MAASTGIASKPAKSQHTQALGRRWFLDVMLDLTRGNKYIDASIGALT